VLRASCDATLDALKDATSHLAALVEQGRKDPASLAANRARGDALAIEVEGDVAFEWRMQVMRAVIASPSDGDAVRELYGEIVDRYRDDPARMAALRPVGDEIRKLEADGTLPSVLVARSDRRSRPVTKP
jgi:hypothetical protein